MIRLLITLLAATICGAQVPDGQDLVRATLGTDYEVYEIAPTGSMKPAIDETYWIVVRQLPWQDIRVGDVILYSGRMLYLLDHSSTTLVCHAVWARSSGGSVLIVKGYANSSPDDVLVTADMYRGTVVATIKRPRLQTP